MESPRHLISQFAAERGVTPNGAKRALYLQALAKDGCTLVRARQRLGVAESTVKLLCRRFLIDREDYRPYAAMEKKGLPRPLPRRNDIHRSADDLPVFAAA